MFVIWGWGGVAESIGRGTFHCPACRCASPYHHQQMRTWFKIFFIPVIPMAPGQRFVECGNCKGTFVEAVLEKVQDANAPSLKVGDYVLGKRGEYWYPGTITAKQFKRYSVQFADGKQTSVSRLEAVPLEALNEGDPVFARSTPEGEFRLGTISDFSDDQILVQFEDGSQEWTALENFRVIWGG